MDISNKNGTKMYVKNLNACTLSEVFILLSKPYESSSISYIENDVWLNLLERE